MSAGSNLDKLARLNGTDKSGVHAYTQHYQTHFGPIRKQRLNLLEIGIGGYDNPRGGGGSLRTWKSFFPRGMIFGIDIHDKSYHDEKRIRTFTGSQVDETFLRGVVREIGDLDIVVDDGSHINEHVIQTFRLLFPMLKPGGFYVVEDTQTSYWREYGGDEGVRPPGDHTAMGFFKGLVDGLNVEEFRIEDYEASSFDTSIHGMHFYHNLIFIEKRSG